MFLAVVSIINIHRNYGFKVLHTYFKVSVKKMFFFCASEHKRAKQINYAKRHT